MCPSCAEMVAHVIREPSRSLSKSICALEADRRWAVTGTPIQNRLTDLFSLFKFLRCSPFDDQKVFNIQVTQNWKTRSDPDSVAKLKTLVTCLSLRRPKTTIELLPRRDDLVYLDFSREEWEGYQRVKSQTLHNLDNVGGQDGGTRFLNALKWVNELRLMCTHGTMNFKETQRIEELPPPWSVQEAQARFDQLDGVGLAKCSNAACCQDLSSALSTETDAEHEDEPFIGESLELWCSLCSKDYGNTATKVFKICNHLPRRSQKQVVRGKNKKCLETDSSGPSSLIALKEHDRLPTKVKRLLQDLLETPEDTKRFAVTLFLDSEATKLLDTASSSPPGLKRSTLFNPSSGRIPSAASASTAVFPLIVAPTFFASFAVNLASECSLPPSHAAASGLT